MLSDIAVFTSQVVNHNVVLWSRVYCSLQFLPWTGSWSEEPKWDLALNFRSLLQRHCVSFGKLMVMRQCISSGTEALQKWKNILERQWVIWKTYHEHQPLKKWYWTLRICPPEMDCQSSFTVMFWNIWRTFNDSYQTWGEKRTGFFSPTMQPVSELSPLCEFLAKHKCYCFHTHPIDENAAQRSVF